jgi:hypothetical protein
MQRYVKYFEIADSISKCNCLLVKKVHLLIESARCYRLRSLRRPVA